MLILKITDKGLYVEIPGALPTRTPAEIDISRCNLSVVDMYLRKNGIKKYQILSGENGHTLKPTPPKMEDASIDQKVINKRFSNLERMMAQILEKQQDNKKGNSEQITNKLENLESLAKKLLAKEPKVIEKVVQTSVKTSKAGTINDEPQIEELDEKFIPSIDVSKMKIKGTSKKTLKQETQDIDDSVDLLSRIMGNND